MQISTQDTTSECKHNATLHSACGSMAGCIRPTSCLVKCVHPILAVLVSGGNALQGSHLSGDDSSCKRTLSSAWPMIHSRDRTLMLLHPISLPEGPIDIALAQQVANRRCSPASNGLRLDQCAYQEPMVGQLDSRREMSPPLQRWLQFGESPMEAKSSKQSSACSEAAIDVTTPSLYRYCRASTPSQHARRQKFLQARIAPRSSISRLGAVPPWLRLCVSIFAHNCGRQHSQNPPQAHY
ncbi:hypothetical protein J3F83DRAFT_195702 [Trichoderma novae-zelandiae]